MTPASRDAQKKTLLLEDPFGEPIASLNIELGRISAEIQSINSGFQTHMQEVLAETRVALERHYEARLDQSVDRLRDEIRRQVRNEIEREFQEEALKRAAHLGSVKSEVARILNELESLGEEINKMLADPAVELSKVMRKHTKQAELNAYLNGLRFAIGDQV